ncbi:hypothetical protein BC829DRAFT_282549 [Chytridium lagenaria]|nr:hypothetical protein BC829DRAFT_282549 [Chytridium lagenaria]
MSPLVTSFAVLVPALLSLGASVVYAQSTVTCGVNTVAVMDFDLRDTEIAPMTTERNYCECASRCEENRECEVFSFGVGGSVRGNCFLRRGGSPSDYTSIFFRMSDRVFSGGYDRGYIASLPSSFTSREACAEAARSNSSCNFVTIQSRPSGLFSCHMYTGDLGTGYQTGFIMGSAPSPDPPVVTTQDPPLESSSSGSPSGAETTTSLSTSQSSITVDGNTALITGAPTQIPSSTSSSLSKTYAWRKRRGCCNRQRWSFLR